MFNHITLPLALPIHAPKPLIWVDQGYTGKRFAHANPQLGGAELEIPLAHRGWVPGVTETVGSGAKLGLLRTLSPPEQG